MSTTLYYIPVLISCEIGTGIYRIFTQPFSRVSLNCFINYYCYDV
nr:MAG TPA: hypothetical protein [Caudoviricetes sp.]